MSVPQEVDVIIIGGGAAGCIVAGRLSAADPSLEILVVEVGKNNLNDPQVVRPANYLSHLAPTSTTAKFHAGRASELLAGRVPIVPTGNILGGGSSINFMMYTRPSRSDYDDWNTEGWAADDLIPLLTKIETHHLPEVERDEKIHGYNGPLHVSHGGCPRENTEEFFQAAKDLGYEVVANLQDFKASHAFERWGKWINPKTGRRSDTAHGYLHPQLEKNSNLHLLVESKVSRIVIEDGKATGIEYVPSTRLAEGVVSTPQAVKARKLVVLSAGALGSPPVLERSGVGAKEILEKAGVKCLVDLPGVGTNYQDHNLILPSYRVSPETGTHDDFLRGIPEVHAQGLKEFEETGKGIYSTNFIDCGSKIRPSEKELQEMGPAFKKYWDEYFKNAQDKPVMFVGVVNAFLGDHSLVPGGNYVTIGSYLEYPASRGTTHITSSDPYVDPDFDPAYLTHEADIAPNMWGYKVGRELVRRMPCYRGELPALHPKFVSPAARCQEIDIETSRELQGDEGVTAGVVVGGNASARNDLPLAPAPTSLKESIVYTEEDNKALEQWIRENIATTWHSLGTLAMKPREQGGVVDKDLNVYGVKNLKVIDLSIAPGNVGSNTYSSALVIGEKGAILAGKHLGISV